MAEITPTPHKRDKIFDNTFEDQDFQLDSSISFQISPQYSDDRDEEDKIQLEMIRRDIHALIINSRFKTFNDLGELAESKKLKKIDINEIYEFISDELVSKYSLIEIFSETTDYFNINPTKFYASLGNKFKEDLIQELDRRTKILKKKKINRLF
jgi:hypothetical protein